jgi:type IV pilus assembly protein PilB
LDLAIPSQWGEAEWQALIDQLPQNAERSVCTQRCMTICSVLWRLNHRNNLIPTSTRPRILGTPEPPSSQESTSNTENQVSLDDEASSFLEGFSAEGVLETAEDEEAALTANAVDLESSLQDAEASPVVALVDRILLQAMSVGASDIHVEPQQKGLRLRYRQDGVLQQYVEPLPSRLIPAVTSRFKILADLDIAERRQAQDGRIRRRYRDRVVDFRVNTLPSRFGEKVCLRLLDSSATQLGPGQADLQSHHPRTGAGSGG